MVHWYTQHPNAPSPPLLTSFLMSPIGNGNVSLDVARMLLTNVDVLRKYDVPERVLDVLAESTVKHVSIAAFTMKELREMINLPDASMVPLAPELLQPSEGVPLTRPATPGSKNTFGNDREDVVARLLSTAPPRGAHARGADGRDVDGRDGNLVVTSLGFHGEPTAPYFDPGLGHLRTLSNPHLAGLRRVHTGCWRRTMMNAYDVAETIVNDRMNPVEGTEARWSTASGNENIVEYPDWKRIDEEEMRRGQVRARLLLGLSAHKTHFQRFFIGV
ncbi:hypothetical protein DFP72DRAFT_904721 [Ephemerocybe angulata]|uniref:Uncharacterized protein n=1 Tax=Ephemerocybe angulata TaxID=980116 RepID=A0A8H6HV63_9AGAR|nr:hypothetical protein DFP72DRAFT_904721 [Tulosesus angulatus]